MKPAISAPVPLESGHKLTRFSCGEPSLDEWLRKQALKNEIAGASRTYVVCCGDEVAGYYSLAVGSIEHALVPGKIRRNMPRAIPVMVLARLAVDLRYKGQCIGQGMVKDALFRTLQAADIAGIRALLVHALNEKAASFYLKIGFVPSPFNPLVLFLPLDTLRVHT